MGHREQAQGNDTSTGIARTDERLFPQRWLGKLEDSRVKDSQSQSQEAKAFTNCFVTAAVSGPHLLAAGAAARFV